MPTTWTAAAFVEDQGPSGTTGSGGTGTGGGSFTAKRGGAVTFQPFPVTSAAVAVPSLAAASVQII